MASTTTWLVVGVVAGVGIGVGAALLWQRQQSTTTATRAGVGGPQFTETNVIRDEQGRIITTQTVRGVGAGAAMETGGDTRRHSHTHPHDGTNVPIN